MNTIHDKKAILELCKKYRKYKNIITVISQEENIDYEYLKLLFNAYGLKENKRGKIFMSNNNQTDNKGNKPSIDFETYDELIMLEKRSKQYICQHYDIKMDTADYWLKCIRDKILPTDNTLINSNTPPNINKNRPILTLNKTPPAPEKPKITLEQEAIVNALINPDITHVINQLEKTTDISVPKSQLNIPKPSLNKAVVSTPTDFLKSNIKKTDSQERIIPKPLENKIILSEAKTDILTEDTINSHQKVIKDNEIPITKSVNELVDSLFADFDFVEDNEKLPILDSVKEDEINNKHKENNDLEANLLIQRIENDIKNINDNLERLKNIIKYK